MKQKLEVLSANETKTRGTVPLVFVLFEDSTSSFFVLFEDSTSSFVLFEYSTPSFCFI
jgi:hypothetical protein